MSKLVTVESRYYHCPDCQVVHRELEDYMLFVCHRSSGIVKVEVEDVQEFV